MEKIKKFKAEGGFKSEDLLNYATDHLKSAYLLFERGGPSCYDSAGYLSHLGIELILKSILLNLKRKFPAEHNLKKLYDEIKVSGGISIKKDEKETLEMINQFQYLRYTNPPSPVEIGDDDWPKIEQLYKSLLRNLPEDIVSRAREFRFLKKGNKVLIKKGNRILMGKPKETKEGT